VVLAGDLVPARTMLVTPVISYDKTSEVTDSSNNSKVAAVTHTKRINRNIFAQGN